MATARQIYDAIDQIAPYRYAEQSDNTGLMIEAEREITKVLLALDVSHAVIDEALRTGAQLILTHHPLIFNPIKRLTHRDLAYRLISAGISCLSAHTNLDSAPGGVNDVLAQRLGLKNVRVFGDVTHEHYDKIIVFAPPFHAQLIHAVMAEAGAGQIGEYSDCAFLSEGTGLFRPSGAASPFIGSANELERVPEVKIEAICPREKTAAVIAAMKAVHPYEEPAFDIFENRALRTESAMGRIGELDAPIQPQAFAYFVGETLGSGSIRYTDGGRVIRRVAVCGGAGGSYFSRALSMGADAFVTADLRYYQAFDALNAELTLIDAGHFATETIVLAPLMAQLTPLFPDISFAVAQSNADGWQYL